MYTVHPSIIIGSYTWDQDRLPRDEFELRQADLHRAMDQNRWQAMFLYGDACEHSAIAYYTGFVPRVRWALALVPREGEPRLLVSMSSRDVPAMKLMTWIPDVLSGWQWESAFDTWLAGMKGDGVIDVGSVGFDIIQARLYQSVERSIGGRVRLVPARGFASADRAMRPRELSLVREACAVVQGAGRAMVQAWRAGSGAEAAALDGERTARSMAAQDVRTLVSPDRGRTLVPFGGEFHAKVDTLVAYIAVKVFGYWAELFVTDAQAPGELISAARSGLDAVKSGLRPGATGAQLFAQGVRPLGSRALHPVLGASVGRRIGLSLNEGADLREDSQRPLEAGSAYALHVGTRDDAGGALVSAMAVLTDKGVEILCSSEDAL